MEAPPEQKKSGFAQQASPTTNTDSPVFSLLARYRGLAVQQRRLAHIFLAALLLLLASWLAFTQPSRPIISSMTTSISGLSTSVGLWRKFAYPLERNPFLRLPVLTSDVNDVFALPGGDHVWAVGDGGLILYSPNAGRCWQQQHPVQGMPCGESYGNSWSLIAGARAADAPKKIDYSEQQDFPVQQRAPVEINPGQSTKVPLDRGGLSFEQQIQKPMDEQLVEKKPGPVIDPFEKERAATPRLNAALKAVYFIDPLRGWAVGEQGLVLSTTDGGQRWQAQSLGDWPLSDVVFNKEASQGWVVGIGGRILRSLDGGASWQPQNSGTRMTLLALSLHEVNDGIEQLCAVGQSGLVLTSIDGGQRWQTQSTGTKNTLTAVSFNDVQQGWAVGSSGTILSTVDTGLSWQAQNSTIEERLRDVSFNADAQVGRVVGENGVVLTTVDGGLSWVVQDSASVSTLLAVSFADAEQGWAVGRDGTLLFSDDGGQSWQLQSSGTSPWLQSLVSKQNSPQQNGASAKDTSLEIDSDGKYWQINNSDVLEGVERSSYNADVEREWAVEPTGRILITTDTGATWTPVVEPYSRWPAPWYYAAVLFALAVAAAPLKAVTISLRHGLRIEERGQSDRPVETQLEDKLDFWPVSQALSRFLRNRHTQPPLTVAITGAWGSGKSSLMNLLKADLSRSGVQAVWFNAWHHESEEEYLLPALLQNIRQQAIPPLLSFNGGRFYGLRFRVRLLWNRLKARPVFLALLLGFVVLNTGFVIVKDRAAFGPEQLALARTAFCKGSELPAFICPLEEEPTEEGAATDWNNQQVALDDGSTNAEVKPESINWLTTLINLILGGSGGAALLKGLRAFGISPAQLAKEIGAGGERQIEQRMGYRHNFQQEFNTVTDALNPRTMLILIDDLDRCQPKTVVQILEAVNFLTSAGRCYVVLGMAREMVEPAVGLAFKDIADEITHHRSGEASDGEQQNNGYAQRREFARKYLEKLINLEIPVPTVEAAQALRLLADNTSAKPATEPWRLSNSLSTLAQGFFFFALILATLWFGNVLGPQSQPGAELASESTSGVDPKPGGVGDSTVTYPATGRDDLGAPLSDTSSDKPAEFIPGAQAPVLPWLPVLVAALIFGFGSYRVLSKLRQAESEETAAVVDDSEPFSRALKVWNPVIASQLETPRELRRFMNRLRYSAVRLNGMSEDSGFENTLSEEEIVSLAALYLLDPACIELAADVDSADEFLRSLEIKDIKRQRSGEGALPLTAPQQAALGQAIDSYTAHGGIAEWGFDDNKINTFKVLLQGIKVH